MKSNNKELSVPEKNVTVNRNYEAINTQTDTDRQGTQAALITSSREVDFINALYGKTDDDNKPH